MPFFLVHYGMFTAVHGTLVGFLAGGSAATGDPASAAGGGVAVVLLVVAAGARAFRRIDPRHAVTYAYGHVIPLHVIPLHLGIFAAFIGLAGGGLLGAFTGGRAAGAGLWTTLVLLALFAVADRIRVGAQR